MTLFCLPAGAAVGGWAGYTKQALLSDVAVLNVNDPDHPGARAPWGEPPPSGSVGLYPSPLNASRDLPKPYADQCQQQSMRAELLRCEYGPKNAEKVVALVGGSHSTQWLPAFEVFAEQDDFKIVNYTKSFCLFSSPAGFGEVYQYPSCTQWNARLMEELIASEPDLVFTTYTRDGGENEYVPQGYIEWFRELEKHDINVLAVRDNPWLPFEPSKCVEMYGVAAEECQVSRAEVLARTDPAVHLQTTMKNVSFIDLSRFFCDEKVCFPQRGNVLIYRDSHHITASYMRTLAAYLRPEVKSAMRTGCCSSAAR
ncbi:SGNH hydrolase domain-containing protein [Halomonas sp. WWR20]